MVIDTAALSAILQDEPERLFQRGDRGDRDAARVRRRQRRLR